MIPAIDSSSTWIVLALLSAVLTSCRHLYLKKFCNTIPSEALIFVTRLFGVLAMLPMVIRQPLTIKSPMPFLVSLTVTVIVTAIATIVQIRVIQRDALSRSVPYLSLIPIFMVPWAIVLLHEQPKIASLAGIVLTCAGAWILNSRRGDGFLAPVKAIFTHRSSLAMVLVSVALGLHYRV